MTARPSRHERGYDSAWTKARTAYLAKHRWCVMCKTMGQQVRATVVDHKKPHKGNRSLFWARSNWQALCKTHHDATKQRDEYRGYESGCDATGMPVDIQHHWRQQSA